MAEYGYRALISPLLGAGLGIVVGAIEFGVTALHRGAASPFDWMQVGGFVGMFGGIVIGFCALIQHPVIRLGAATLLGTVAGMSFAAFMVDFAQSLAFADRINASAYWTSIVHGSLEGVIPGALFGLLVIVCMNALAARYRRAQ